jgi:hypothetical protein
VRKLVLCVIDGLSAGVLEAALGDRSLPAISRLAEAGSYGRAVSTFPSVTPVCLSSIATGAGPEVHGIPHLAWWNADEERVVEYGSSFAAVRAAGVTGSLRDAVLNMSAEHLSPRAETVFEALEDAGLVTAAVTFTCYRGRTRHTVRLPGSLRRGRWYETVAGPSRFFFFNLYESDATGAPLAVRSRARGSVDRYAVHVGRWLVTRDAFDFLVYYLPDYDYAAHSPRPDAARSALVRADAALAALMDAAGGPEAFLERYALLVCADHGQSRVARAARLEERFAELDLWRGRRGRHSPTEAVVCASNRAAMVYLLPAARASARELAERLDGDPAADVVLFREDGEAVARREGAELRFAPAGDGYEQHGDAHVLDPDAYPDGIDRAWRALACPRAGDVVVSAAEGWEFADLGGRHHAGGGSHGSLLAGDSLVPVLRVGLDGGTEPRRITDLKGAVLAHFGLRGRAAARAA